MVRSFYRAAGLLLHTDTIQRYLLHFPPTESADFLLEGDLFIPKKRNAMKCLNDAFNCLWPKSSDGKVWLPYLISEKYGRWPHNGRGLIFICSVTD